MGPVAIGDASLGLEARVWRARAAGGAVYLARWIDGTGWDESELFTYAGAEIDELSVAFDQGGAPVIAAERAGDVWIRFFDPLLGAQAFTDFGAGRTPLAVLDDADPSVGDVQVLYLSAAHQLVHRQERDRYQVEIATGSSFTALDFLEVAARTQTDRLAVVLSRRDAVSGTYALARVESGLFPHHVRENAQLSGLPTFGELADKDFRPVEPASLSGAPTLGSISESGLVTTSFREDASLSGAPILGTLRNTIQTTTLREDSSLSGSPRSGSLVAVIVSTTPREDSSLSGYPTGGTLV
jgi:hypothetical protein